MSLEESYNPQIGLDVFKEDPNFQETEKKYEVGLMRFCKHRSAARIITASGWLPSSSADAQSLTETCRSCKRPANLGQ